MRISDWSSDVCSSDLLTGENGAGKTNVLEAVSLLAPGRGLRQAPLKEVARQPGPGGFAVAAVLAAEGGAVEIGTGATTQAPERRPLRINGATAALTALGEWLSVLWFQPALDRLFTACPSGPPPFPLTLTICLFSPLV